MIEKFEERKAGLLQYLEEEYRKKPQKWWHNQQPEYKTTSDFRDKLMDSLPGDEIVIRNNKKEAAGLVAFFVFVGCCMYIPWRGTMPDGFNIFCYVVFVSFITVPQLNRKPRMKINRDGLWTHKWGGTVPWRYMVAIYVIIEKSDDTSTHTLIVHYYDNITDLFYKLEFPIRCFDYSTGQIVAYIEYWKEKNKLLHN